MSARLLFVLLVFVFLPVAWAQDTGNDRDLRRYLEIVEQYRGGDRVPAVEAIARWEAGQLVAVREELPNSLRPYWDGVQVFIREEQVTTLDQAREARKPTPLQLLATAMMVHTEAARRAGGAAIERQLDFARTLWDLGAQMERAGQRVSLLLPENEARTRFKAQWHVLAGTILLGSERVPQAAEHFAIALDLHPDDPIVLLAAGSLQERYAARLEPEGAPGAPGGEPAPASGRDDYLERARDLYARSLALQPGPGEARVRHARVLSLLGEHERAATEVSLAFASPLTPNVEYLARMVAGRVEQARGALVEARANFLSARRLCGGCQSATLALGSVRLASGDRAGARALVGEFVRHSTPDASNDPWWTYHRGQWHEVDALLEHVRGMVPR